MTLQERWNEESEIIAKNQEWIEEHIAEMKCYSCKHKMDGNPQYLKCHKYENKPPFVTIPVWNDDYTKYGFRDCPGYEKKE